ncbi:MAG TPA: hypothetical protein VFP43_09045 [Mesorhizobium sp.]|nr:hypothetical protein [Mesorhizobium sp.]
MRRASDEIQTASVIRCHSPLAAGQSLVPSHLNGLLTNIVRIRDNPNPPQEKPMDRPISAQPDEKTPALDLSLAAQFSKLATQESSKLSAPLENNADRIRSSVARLTANSIDELQGLVSELQKMQEFLKSEVDSVQRQIDSALAGINIIVETIGPWKSIAVSQATQNGQRSVRGPAANIEPAQSRRMSG